MKDLQIRSELKETTRTRAIYVINSFVVYYVPQYETQGET